MLTQGETNDTREFSLENEFARFKLWNHGSDGLWNDTPGDSRGRLDEILSYSVYLKESTITLLSNLISCLLMREFADSVPLL